MITVSVRVSHSGGGAVLALASEMAVVSRRVNTPRLCIHTYNWDNATLFR